MRKLIFILAFVMVCHAGCEEKLLTEEFPNTVLGNYDAFWAEYDRSYGAFEAKKINWDSLGKVYRKQLEAEPTNNKLFGSLCKLLDALNDGHADLFSPELGSFISWNKRDKSLFADTKTSAWNEVIESRQVIQAHYLHGTFKKNITPENYMFFYGTMDTLNKKIGYLCLPTFKTEEMPQGFINEAIDVFRNLDGIVVDIRFNGGGGTEAFVETLKKLSSERKIYLKSRFRNGPAHSDFSKLYTHYTATTANSIKNKSIAILVNSFTGSSAEHFLMGMRTQKNVFTVGDTTRGAFSQVWGKILPNGWQFRCGAQVVFNEDGQYLSDSHGEYLEGIGIAPDFYVQDQITKIRMGNDLVLNAAIKQILARQK
jgi:carboxyl-terminal processing protease